MLQNLNNRERLLVLAGLPLVCLIAFFLYVWQPLYEEQKRLRIDVPKQQATLAWMKNRLAGRMPGDLAAASGASADQPLLTVIENLAIAAKIQNSIQRVQPGNKGNVEIWFQDVVADQLFRWIDQLSVRGIQVDSATVTRGTPGVVAARLKVGRKAPG